MLEKAISGSLSNKPKSSKIEKANRDSALNKVRRDLYVRLEEIPLSAEIAGISFT